MQILYSDITGTEPVTQEEVKAWLKTDFDNDDTLITSLITQIRELAEEAAGRSLIAKTITYFEEDSELLCDWIKLPYPNHNAITEVTLNGEVTTSYSKTGLTQFLILLSGAVTNNSDTADDKGLKVEYTTTGVVPAGVKLAMLKEIAETYEKRGNTFEGSLTMLTSNFYNYLQQFKAY